MNIDGQCHCGRVSYQADIDPERVSICHCTDCQHLTGSPYRVTVLCSASQVRVSGTPKIYAKSGDNGRTRFQHFCPECGSPLFTSGESERDDWGIRWGSIRQRDRLKPARQIWCRSAAPWIDAVAQLPGRPADCPSKHSELANEGAPGLNTRRGRLAQLVRASRLHREGRRFESVAAYQPSPCGLRLGKPAAAHLTKADDVFQLVF
jgi:hypothetical protein